MAHNYAKMTSGSPTRHSPMFLKDQPPQHLRQSNLPPGFMKSYDTHGTHGTQGAYNARSPVPTVEYPHEQVRAAQEQRAQNQRGYAYSPSRKPETRPENLLGPQQVKSATYKDYLPWWLRKDNTEVPLEAPAYAQPAEQYVSAEEPYSPLHRLDKPSSRSRQDWDSDFLPQRAPSCPPEYQHHSDSDRSGGHMGRTGMFSDNSRAGAQTQQGFNAGQTHESASPTKQNNLVHTLGQGRNTRISDLQFSEQRTQAQGRPSYQLSDIETMIRIKVQERTHGGQGEMRNIFKLFDRDCTGKICRPNVKEACELMGIFLKPDELDAFMEKFMDKGTGIIHPNSLLTKLMNPSWVRDRKFQGKAMPTLAYDRGVTNLAMAMSDITRATYPPDFVLTLIRSKVRERTKGGAYELREAFRFFDKDGSGYIDSNELNECCLDFNLALKGEEIHEMMANMGGDPHNQFRVSCHDFVHTIIGADFYDSRKRPGMKASEKDVMVLGKKEKQVYDFTSQRPEYDINSIETLYRMKLQERMSGSPYEMCQAVKFFRADKDGYMTVQGLHEASTTLGIQLQVSEIQKVVDTYKDATGKIRVTTFINTLLNPHYIRERKFQGKANPSLAYQRDSQKNLDAIGRISRPTLDVDELVTMIREKIRERTKGGAFELKESFRYFDKDGVGCITESDLQEAMQSFHFPLKQEELQSLLVEYGDVSRRDGGKGISCKVFINKILDYKPLGERANMVANNSKKEIIFQVPVYPKPTLSDTYTANRPTYKKEDLETMIRQKIQERTAGGPYELRHAYKFFDKEGHGSQTLEQFQQSLRDQSVEIKDEEVLLFANDYPGRKPGTIDIAKFISDLLTPAWIRKGGFQGRAAPTQNFNSKQSDPNNQIIMREPYGVDELCDLIRDKLKERTKGGNFELREMFRYMDKDGTGFIRAKDIKAVMLSFNLVLFDEEVDRLIARYDDDNTGRISAFNFINKMLNPSMMRRSSMTLFKKAAGTDDDGYGKKPFSYNVENGSTENPRLTDKISDQRWGNPFEPQPL